MMALAFWNVYKGKGKGGAISTAIVDLAEAICVDKKLSGKDQEVLLCLGEPGKIDFQAILAALQARNTGKTWWLDQTHRRFAILSTLPQSEWDPEDTLHAGSFPSSLVRTTSGKPIQYEIWFTHLSTPAYSWHPNSLNNEEARDLRVGVETREQNKLHKRSVVIGDFNMEPFSQSMTTPQYMNATPCRTLAATNVKIARRKSEIRYFFNPMWTLLGSWQANRQPGSFYRNDATASVNWHVIDQVIVRPELIGAVYSGTPMILANAGMTPLTTREGAIASISDHLPVLVTLDI